MRPDEAIQQLVDAVEAANLRVTLGLSPEQRERIAAMLAAGEGWAAIGGVIGWDPETARDWYERDAGFVVLRERAP